MTPEQLAKSGTEHGEQFYIESNVVLSDEEVKGDGFNASRNASRAARIAASLCRDCGKNSPVVDKVVCQSCSDKRSVNSISNRVRRTTNKQCSVCKAPVNGKTQCEICSSKQIERMRQVRKRNKLAIVNFFGNKCCKCNENDIRCLTLDHVDNDGAEDCKTKKAKLKRMLTTQWYARLYRKLINGTLINERLQLLCANCHMKKDHKLWWL